MLSFIERLILFFDLHYSVITSRKVMAASSRLMDNVEFIKEVNELFEVEDVIQDPGSELINIVNKYSDDNILQPRMTTI